MIQGPERIEQIPRLQPGEITPDQHGLVIRFAPGSFQLSTHPDAQASRALAETPLHSQLAGPSVGCGRTERISRHDNLWLKPPAGQGHHRPAAGQGVLRQPALNQRRGTGADPGRQASLTPPRHRPSGHHDQLAPH
jgi:hypothetical protein